MPIDKVGVKLFYLPKKRLAFEFIIFHGKEVAFINFSLFYDGASPKDVQELLGHADVSTTMNIYAHATREAKRTSARLLDKVIGGE